MFFSSVLGKNATRYVLSGTLTEVENVLQDFAELPGTNHTGHVSYNETPAEADDILQECSDIPGTHDT